MPTTTATSPRFQARPVVFQHIRTGRLVSAPSITAFARKARLGVYGKYQFDNVLKGHRIHVRGWGLPTTLNRQLAIKDIWGNRTTASVAQLSQHLSGQAINRLIAGRRAGPIAPEGHSFGAAIPPREYRTTGYAFRKGDRVIRGRTMAQVAAQAGCSKGLIYSVVHGLSAATGTGFRLHSVSTVKRRPFVPAL